ncbi:MAG: hypothetical protein KC910_10015 [Candidatus Eremiobacteraeota bacterium]|nr:hypothetical protein [Candidatus Eremiobacteraeota bacterium]
MRSAFSTLEMVTGLAVVVMVVALFVDQTGLRHRVLVGTTARGLQTAFEQWKAQASVDGTVKIVFRPRGGPYQSFTPSQGGQPASTRQLQRGVYLLNTDGLIVDDELYLDAQGHLLDPEGKPLALPEPPVLTVVSSQCDTVSHLLFQAEKGILSGPGGS